MKLEYIKQSIRVKEINIIEINKQNRHKLEYMLNIESK